MCNACNPSDRYCTLVKLPHVTTVIVFICQITNRFFQAIPAPEVKQHLFKLLVDTLLETKEVVIGNAAKSSLLKVQILLLFYVHVLVKCSR